jgi:uncharacterized protein
VILLDANLLVYAYAPAFEHHDRARQWLEDVLNGDRRVGLPWPSLLAFLRLVTNPRVIQPAQPMSRAWQVVREWLALDITWIPMPTENHADVMHELVVHVGNRSQLVPDVHLAALALEHGLVLCSADGDFARFPGLRWNNPLA